MRAGTHISFSQFLYLLLVSSAGLTFSPLAAAGAALASVAPDIDSGGTLAGRVSPRLTRWLETRFGHRTITHSALAVATVIVVLLPVALLDATLYLCLILGYASHPVLDTMTVTGVQLFYPFSTVRCVFPMDTKHPHRYRVRTGGSTDTTLGIAFLLLCVPAYLIARAGHEHLIRSVQKDIESAVREYRELEHEYRVYATLEARHTLSGNILSGTFEIVGAPDARTMLLLDSAGMMRSVGVRARAEFLSQKILCQRGERIQTTSREYDLSGRLLGEPLAGSAADRLFLFGELELEVTSAGVAEPPWFSPVRLKGNRLTLEYARATDLVRLGLAGAPVKDGTIRTRSRGAANAAEAPRTATSMTRYELKGSSFGLRCREGDFIMRDSVLAVSDNYEELVGQASTLSLKQALLEGERLRDLEDISRRLASARGELNRDSAALQNLTALLREGFALESHREEAQGKTARARALQQDLLGRLEEQRARHALQTAELREQLLENQRRQDRATLRARTAGHVRSIRITEGHLLILLDEQ